MQEKLAAIEKNTETGIYGKAAAGVFAGESYPVATKAEVKKGRGCAAFRFGGQGRAGVCHGNRKSGEERRKAA